MGNLITPAGIRSRLHWGRLAVALIAGALSFAALQPRLALGNAAWPAKPIQAVVAFPAGGISDVLMRTVAAKLAQVFGQPIVVDVRPGADGNIAAEFVARAPADGHTWLLTSVPFTVQPTLRPQSVRFDPIKDFDPVALISSSLNVFAVPASLPVSTLKEFVAYAKTRKIPLTFASPGNGTGSHLGMELFKRTAGIDLVHVPYKGQPPAIVDLIEGRVDSASMAISLALPHLKSGKLKALAVVDSDRSPQLPDVPTIVEAGYPDAVASAWQVLFVPENTPKPIVKRINEEIMKALKSPDVIAQLAGMGLTPAKSNTPEDVARLIESEIVRWAKIVKDARIVAE
jgi:tripartite-type tricarboxylate transporter receptor subunit TctC